MRVVIGLVSLPSIYVAAFSSLALALSLDGGPISTTESELDGGNICPGDQTLDNASAW